MEDLEESLKAIESESLEKGKPQGLLRRFWNLCPLFVGRAFFSYLPLAISYLFKDTAGHDFMASVFLSLSFVFIAQINNRGYICRQTNYSKTKEYWAFFLYGLRVFLGLCTLAIYAARLHIFYNVSTAWTLGIISFLTLIVGVYMEESQERSLKQAQQNLPQETFKQGF
ncbi:hypothetical protein [Helicobacter felis]|uniref:hypothetical protein n=1 Tax=Helicobacter felis TaxID=214 RepID=UPI000CF0DC11|nr:hypothetical protein [Helicobacter felis]